MGLHLMRWVESDEVSLCKHLEMYTGPVFTQPAAVLTLTKTVQHELKVLLGGFIYLFYFTFI